MTGFNHPPVGPGSSPVMYIALRDLRFIRFCFYSVEVVAIFLSVTKISGQNSSAKCLIVAGVPLFKKSSASILYQS